MRRFAILAALGAVLVAGPWAAGPVSAGDVDHSRSVDVWYGTLTIRNSAGGVVSTADFVRLDVQITVNLAAQIGSDVTVDPRARALSSFLGGGADGMGWVLSTAGYSNAENDLSAAFAAAAGAAGPGTLVTDDPVNGGGLGSYSIANWTEIDGEDLIEHEGFANVTFVEVNATHTLAAVPIVDSFFLPKKVAHKKNAAAPAKSVFKASGFFDTGSKLVDLTASATLSVGGFDFQVPSLTASTNGRTFTYQSGGLKFVVVKNPFGSSRAKFRLTFTGDLGATVPTDGNVELSFSNDAVDGNCEVLLENGGFRIGKKRGALSKPNVFVVRSHAFVNGGGKDSLAIIVGLATGGVTPDTAPEVRVQYGSVLTATIPAGSFTRAGDAYVFKGDIGGITLVIADFLREQVTIVGKNLDLGTFPAGQSPLTIIVGVGTDDRGVAVRVARQGYLLKY